MAMMELEMKNRPHLVILGAGASVATIPHGDKNGLKISAMDNFVSTLGMDNILKGIKFKSNNLEDIYSDLDSNSSCTEVKKQLEIAIYEYFSRFCLPDYPTIYDYLILSLRQKDCIASFNWDPLLLQAYSRVYDITDKLPQLIFLHGSINIGVCYNHSPKIISSRKNCPHCYNELTPVPLLYPVRKKNYTENTVINSYWNVVRQYLKHAYLLTIFGYSAPKTDQQAIQLFQDAWGENETRNLEDIEIIDLKTENELCATWDSFIHTHHYTCINNFFCSSIAKFPRRSTEALFDRTMNVKWLNPTSQLTEGMSWNSLRLHFQDIIEEESEGKILYARSAV